MELIEGLGIDAKLLLAQILNFLVLLFVLYKLLYKPLLNLLEKRKKMIEESLKTAEKIKQEDEALAQKKIEILNKARKETLKIIQEAKTEGESLKREIIKKAGEEAQKILDKTQIQMKEEREKILQEAKKEIADLAILIAASLIKKKLDQKTDQGLINQAIKELTKTKEQA